MQRDVLQFNGGVGRIIGGSAKKKVSLKNSEDILMKMWSAVRQNNGIMVTKLCYYCSINVRLLCQRKSKNDKIQRGYAFGTRLVLNFEYGTVSGDDDLDHLFRSMEFFTEKTQL